MIDPDNIKEQYNVRILKLNDGTFVMDQDCYMHRLATRKNRMKRVRKIEPERVMEWVDASATDRAKLEKILEQGQR